MGFNPFATVDDYPGMLNKISTFTFAGSILAVWFLRAECRSVDALLAHLALPIPVASGLLIPLGTVLPAFLIAFLSRVFKFHDRLSDLFAIRRRFDVTAILLPLAVACNANLTVSQIRQIKKNRQDLMYKLFYRYASSSPGKAVIERHYITMALDQWCWYWILLEVSALVFLLSLVFLSTGRYPVASACLAGVLLLIGALQLVRNFCADYALQEVEQIAASDERRAAIAAEFHALQGGTSWDSVRECR
jgi:hypothetical protein